MFTPRTSTSDFTAYLNRDELLEFYCADLSDRQCPRDKDVQENKVEKVGLLSRRRHRGEIH